MSNPLSGVNAPCNTSTDLTLNTNPNQSINHLPITNATEKARRHSFSMSNSVQSPRPHLVKNLEMSITSAGIVDEITERKVSKNYISGLNTKKEKLTQNIPAQQTLTRIINLVDSISTTGNFSSDCIYKKITEASQNCSEPPIKHHQDNEFGGKWNPNGYAKNKYGNEPWPTGTIPTGCKLLNVSDQPKKQNDLTNLPHPFDTTKSKEENEKAILTDTSIHWPVDMNDKTKEKHLSQLSREINTFSGSITIRRLLPGEVLMRDIGKGQSVKASCWTKGNGKDFVHNGPCLHQNLAVKPEWNGGGTLAIFIVPNEGEFYVAEGKIASQEIKGADGSCILKGGGTQLNILTPEGESFSGNEEIFNKCVAVIPNAGIDLTDDIPDKIKKEKEKSPNPFN